jgi:hypothetical protein
MATISSGRGRAIFVTTSTPRTLVENGKRRGVVAAAMDPPPNMKRSSKDWKHGCATYAVRLNSIRTAITDTLPQEMA